MKNFSIENLERKNPYKTPENFFEEMQENVLKNTTAKERENSGKVFKLNFSWAIAAAVAVIFGLAFFFVNNDKNSGNTFANSENPQQQNVTKNPETATNTSVQTSNEATTNYHALQKEIARAENKENASENYSSEQKNQKTTETVALNNNNEDTEYKMNEADMENILASFTNEDLKQLSKNTEQDVYLDLYN